jgi:hypothetical protein
MIRIILRTNKARMSVTVMDEGLQSDCPASVRVDDETIIGEVAVAAKRRRSMAPPDARFDGSGNAVAPKSCAVGRRRTAIDGLTRPIYSKSEIHQ